MSTVPTTQHELVKSLETSLLAHCVVNAPNLKVSIDPASCVLRARAVRPKGRFPTMIEQGSLRAWLEGPYCSKKEVRSVSIPTGEAASIAYQLTLPPPPPFVAEKEPEVPQAPCPAPEDPVNTQPGAPVGHWPKWKKLCEQDAAAKAGNQNGAACEVAATPAP
jgi:hypothetical protein